MGCRTPVIKDVHTCNGTPEEKERKEWQNYLNSNDWKCPQVNIRYQITDVRILENTKQYN
jgi:hypothetical protein